MKYAKLLSSIALAAMIAMVSMPAQAQGTNLKIGWVNLAQLRESAPQAEQAQRVLEEEFSQREQELRAEQRAVQQLEQRLAREGDTITDPEERQRLERELRMRQRELQRDAQTWEEDVNMRRNEELGRLHRLIFMEIQAFAREQGYDMVLVEGVVHATERVDVTAQVLSRLEARAAEDR